jgi:Trk K+ transport system NAD-binding subunit
MPHGKENMMPQDPAAAMTNHVVVCGLGHVGYRTIRLLIRLGQRGVVITKQVNEDWRHAIEPQFHVIVGDAQDDKLLQQAGLAGAKAVIIVTDDDLANLSIALDARRMNPQAALVVRQFDQDLAIHLEQSADIDRALSASALAAPPFVAAALGTTVRCCFAVGDALCALGEHHIEPNSRWKGCTLGQWSADAGQAVLAVRRNQDVIVPSGPDMPLATGDCLIALGMPNEHGGSDPVPRCCPHHTPRISALHRFRLAIHVWWREIPRALQVAMIVLLVVVLTSVGVFHAALDLPWTDALYFVVTTITTVGFGDYNLMSAPSWLKFYGAFVMLCGAAILATIFGITTDFILRTRLRDVMAHGAEHWRDHVIVAGLGKIGFRLVRDLVEAGETVVAIENRPDAPFVQAARELVPVVLGNAKNEETLRKAGAAGARIVIAATDDDLANLSTALAAKRIQPSCRAVLRIFNSELAEKMQQGLAMDAVLSASAVAAPTFAGAALCPDILHGLLLGDWLTAIYHQVIDGDGSNSKDKSPKTVENQAVLFVKRTGTRRYQAVATATVLAPGDEVVGVRWYALAKSR